MKDKKQEAGDHARQYLAGGNIVIHQGITEERAREIAVDASRETVLREGRAVAEAVIFERIEHLTDLIFELINQSDAKLFNRFEDPRFLAALISAQRGYAETGDEALAAQLANLVVSLATQPVRARREIFVRQAIEVAQQLTTEHLNALSVQLYITSLKLGEPYFEPDWLIRALDTLLNHYYGRLPTNPLDYQYMASIGVCYTDQLSAFASGPFERLHERYANAMYPSFTEADVHDLISDENPDHAEYQSRLAVHAATEDDVTAESDNKTRVTLSGARFRLEPAAANRILVRERDLAAVQLTPVEEKLRELVLQRTLTVDQFKAEVAAVKPELANFLDFIQRKGALNFHLNPVGYVLAQHEIKTRAPQLAAVIDAEIDRD